MRVVLHCCAGIQHSCSRGEGENDDESRIEQRERGVVVVASLLESSPLFSSESTQLTLPFSPRGLTTVVPRFAASKSRNPDKKFKLRNRTTSKRSLLPPFLLPTAMSRKRAKVEMFEGPIAFWTTSHSLESPEGVASDQLSPFLPSTFQFSLLLSLSFVCVFPSLVFSKLDALDFEPTFF